MPKIIYEARCAKTDRLYEIIDANTDARAKVLYEKWKKMKRPPAAVKLRKVRELA